MMMMMINCLALNPQQAQIALQADVGKKIITLHNLQ